MYYFMTRLLLLTIFFSCTSFLANAQTVADSTAKRLKGGIWTLTAKSVFRDLSLKPNPREWKTDSEFKSWVNQKGKEDMGGNGRRP